MEDSASDKVFTSVIASSLFGGTVSTILLTSSGSLVPIVPAIFFGLGLSSMIYKFLGGIKSDAKFQVGTIKLTGSLGALLFTIAYLNTAFEGQIKERIRASSLSISPEENSILALNKDTGEAVEVNIGIKDIPITGKTITVPQKFILEKIQEACIEGRGFCKEEKDANFEVDESVPLGQAKVCDNTANKYIGYPFLITAPPKKTIQRVNVSLKSNCIDPPDEPITIKLHPNDAKEILGNSKKGLGKARLAPLRDAVIVAEIPQTSTQKFRSTKI